MPKATPPNNPSILIVILVPILLLISNFGFAFELDLADRYVEVSFGNIQYNTPQDFFFTGDSYDNPTNIQILVGTHFKRSDKKIISVEGFYNIMGESDSNHRINSTTRNASIEASTFGAGLRLGKPIGESFILSTRFGLHLWQIEGTSNQANTEDSITGEGADENGIGAYIGVNLSYTLSKQLFISAGGQAFPMDIEGNNIHVTNYYLGAGYYF
ncbi:MAG: porin family protein [Pseudomonadales bacterium]|nr:porin family protein [Pseudomonadales bacterium]